MNELMRTLKRPINFYSTRIAHNSRRLKNKLELRTFNINGLAFSGRVEGVKARS